MIFCRMSQDVGKLRCRIAQVLLYMLGSSKTISFWEKPVIHIHIRSYFIQCSVVANLLFNEWLMKDYVLIIQSVYFLRFIVPPWSHFKTLYCGCSHLELFPIHTKNENFVRDPPMIIHIGFGLIQFSSFRKIVHSFPHSVCRPSWIFDVHKIQVFGRECSSEHRSQVWNQVNSFPMISDQHKRQTFLRGPSKAIILFSVKFAVSDFHSTQQQKWKNRGKGSSNAYCVQLRIN
jgi:hypothetical protein